MLNKFFHLTKKCNQRIINKIVLQALKYRQMWF